MEGRGEGKVAEWSRVAVVGVQYRLGMVQVASCSIHTALAFPTATVTRVHVPLIAAGKGSTVGQWASSLCLSCETFRRGLSSRRQ